MRKKNITRTLHVDLIENSQKPLKKGIYLPGVKSLDFLCSYFFCAKDNFFKVIFKLEQIKIVIRPQQGGKK